MTTINKLIQEKEKEFGKKCHIECGSDSEKGFLIFPFAVKQNNYKPVPFLSESKMKSFLSTAIQEGYELGIKDVEGKGIKWKPIKRVTVKKDNLFYICQEILGLKWKCGCCNFGLINPLGDKLNQNYKCKRCGAELIETIIGNNYFDLTSYHP